MRHFEIRHSEFDASALRFKHRGPLSRDRSGPYTTQKLNLLTGGTDKLFRGPWQGTVADVIELLNRDYPRVIGCGDTETGHSSLLPSRFPSATTLPSPPPLHDYINPVLS